MSLSAPELGQIPLSPELAATLAHATDAAAKMGFPEVTLELLLAVLCEDPDALAILDASRIDANRLKADAVDFLSRSSAAPIDDPSKLSVSADVRRILEAAAAAARGGRRRDINGAILLAAIVGDGQSIAAQMLQSHGLTFESAIRALQSALSPSRERAPPAATEDVLARARERVQSRAAPTLRDLMSDIPRPAPPPPIPGYSAEEAEERELSGNSPPSAMTPLGAGEDAAAPKADEASEAAEAAIELANEAPPAEVQSAAGEVKKAKPAADPSAIAKRGFYPPQPQPKSPLSAAGPPHSQSQPAPVAPPVADSSANAANPSASGPREGGGFAFPAPPPDIIPPPPVLLPPGAPASAPMPGPPPPRDFPIPYENRQPGPHMPPPIPPKRPGPPAGGGGPAGPLSRPMFAPPGQAPRGGVMPGQPVPQPAGQRAGPGPLAVPGAPAVAAPARERHTKVEAGQLAENIPRAMRVGVTERIEVRVARASVKALTSGLEGGGLAWRHDITVTQAMSVRLRAPEGGFFIETASPETQWIENALGFQSDEFASWRFLVTPRTRGWSRLQIIVSARTVGGDGVAAETALPDQVVEVKVRTNLKRLLSRWSGWVAAAIVGGALARFGEAGFDFAEPLIQRFLH